LRVSQAHSEKYRADVDGLRAIAVICVLGFHAGILTFRGGFVGVDVFFVISGFLIGGIVFDALDSSKFSFVTFYKRRVNRIFPALILVLGITALAGWLVLFNPELRELGQHLVGGATFSSNFILWKQAGYFSLPEKPLLHLWSLAVEEQFYLFFPLAMWLAWRARWDRRWLLIALIEISFLLNVWAVRHGQATAAFFLPHTRIWEILAGALLADLQRKPPRTVVAFLDLASIRNAAAALGSAMLVTAVATLSDKVQWPGFAALLPVVGTLLLVAAGPHAWVNRKLLGHPFLVAIGLISYPLYLWHWPLLVFANLIHEGPPPLWVRVLLLAVSFALATVTYTLIERPIRFGNRKKNAPRRLVVAAIALGAGGLILSFANVPSRLEVAHSRSLREIGLDWEVPDDGTLIASKAFKITRLPGDTSGRIVLVGDSHIQQYWPRILELKQRDPQGVPEVVLMTYGGCPPLPRVNRQGVSWDGHPWNCPAFFRGVREYLRTTSVHTVVIGGFWEDYPARNLLISDIGPANVALGPNDPRWDEIWHEFANQIASLTNRGDLVFIVLPNPTRGRANNEGSRRLAGLGRTDDFQESISRVEYLKKTHDIRNRLADIAARTGARLIDPSLAICSTSECAVYAEHGMPIFKDDHHFRAGFVRRYGGFFDVVVTTGHSGR
jgi:peptidoglycan/LPS O-acetylase OafA/YrhL